MSERLKLLEAMDVYLPDVDGVVNCMHNYCLNLYDKTELTVVVPQNRKDYVDKQIYQIHRCNSIHVPVLNDYYGLPATDKKIKELIKTKELDVVHVHSPFNMAKFALKIAKKKKIPAIATFHSNMYAIFKDIVKFPFIAKLMNDSLGKRYNKFDEVFVCSPLVEKQLRFTGYKGKVSYLPFGTDFPVCENVEENRSAANEVFGLNENDLVFIYVGRIMKLKRIDFILKSLKIVKDKGYSFKFYVTGKGVESEKLKKLSEKLGFSDKEVIFTGFLPREQFPLLYSRADLLLFPSLYDNFGLVKVEGAAFETPGVFIKDSCAGYGVTDGVDGFLSDNDEASFADKVISASKDRAKLREIGKTAAKTQYVSWETCANAFLERTSQIVKEYKEKKQQRR